ncbi:hypothetical protein G7B40_015265 [Aetokthonos hydrillicola Thurmond2011]|jgi:hypothetical protein|uniref:Uncharacterized protein n=1 Tax=Aetokthonos hydrillicola Thurmond2011 TaxID=2712845 RepID=A0AAP5I6I9_9CYAN|nr:hypothetical protein [Aetokthonos hydrillicola]MBW4588754.1 hypothetical protein [Aetokthonos hydrillicola CCALA 1050]MDR9895912.1 hypothetical protein [Aetokthonos hydrillicola Thurmond2011]
MFLKNRALTTIVSSIFALGFLSLATSVKAEESRQALNCTNSLLRGYYAASSSGFTSGSTPFNLVFLDKFDGNGNITGVRGSTSSGGQISQNLSNTGTYQVNSDCTVTITFTTSSGNSTNFGVIVDNGRKVRYIGTESGQNISGTLERINY